MVDRAIDADTVVTVLDRLAAERGRPPAFLRFDNGPEFIAHAVADWCQFNDVDTVSHGAPTEFADTWTINQPKAP